MTRWIVIAPFEHGPVDAESTTEAARIFAETYQHEIGLSTRFLVARSDCIAEFVVGVIETGTPEAVTSEDPSPTGGAEA